MGTSGQSYVCNVARPKCEGQSSDISVSLKGTDLHETIRREQPGARKQEHSNHTEEGEGCDREIDADREVKREKGYRYRYAKIKTETQRE